MGPIHWDGVGTRWPVGEQVLCDVQRAKAASVDAEPRHHRGGHSLNPLMGRSWYAVGEQVLSDRKVI